MTEKILINELLTQNPWWKNTSTMAEDPLKEKRDIYNDVYNKVVNDNLITAVTGLRRIGKTTLVKQIINELLTLGIKRNTILYYSFEESSLSQYPGLLEELIKYQLKIHKKEKLYFFFDEIQYVNLWNAVLKKYIDAYPNLKFTITGSSSLFIKSTARESLAGRILETIMRPLSFSEYKKILNKQDFYDYLTFGEYPYLSKLTSFEDQKQYILDWVIGKVVESDLPKIKRIIHTPTLVNLTNILISGSGSLIELQNLAQDLGLDRKTLSSYLKLLEDAHLITSVFNLGSGYRTRSQRLRKIYSSSVNAVVMKNTIGKFSESFNLKIGQIVENYILNYLISKKYEVFFWNKRGKEIDFITHTPEKTLPIEVKYQSQIKKEDLKTIIDYCQKEKLKECLIITKDLNKKENIKNININYIPAEKINL